MRDASAELARSFLAFSGREILKIIYSHLEIPTNDSKSYRSVCVVGMCIINTFKTFERFSICFLSAFARLESE